MDLLTRLITAPEVDPIYGEAEEVLAPGDDATGGARIVRLPAGPPELYLRKVRTTPPCCAVYYAICTAFSACKARTLSQDAAF